MARQSEYLVLPALDLSALETFTRTGSHSSRSLIRAQVLLLNHQGYKLSDIATLLGISYATASTTRARYKREGLNNALSEKVRSGAPRKITAELEAHITAVVCTDAPEGRVCWTLELLRDEIVQLNYVESISKESVRTVLKKVNSNLGERNNGVSRR
jgi:putative transposase